MRTILLFLLLLSKTGWGQDMMATSGGGTTSPQAALGYISVPSLMSLQVATNVNNVRFENPFDFKSGKHYSGFLNLKVVSTQPWLISMKTMSAFFTPLSQGASANMPVDVMRLKRTGTDTWVPLSSTTRPLLYSDNKNISNNFLYDALFELGWNYRSGDYTTTILFTLSPQ